MRIREEPVNTPLRKRRMAGLRMEGGSVGSCLAHSPME